jgi:methyl-accepting chemotaxis protein
MSFKVRIYFGFIIIIFITCVLAVSLNSFSKIQHDLFLKNNAQEKVLAPIDIIVLMFRVKQYLTDAALTQNQSDNLAAADAANTFNLMISHFIEGEHVTQDKKQKLDLLKTNFDMFYQNGKKMSSIYISQGHDAGNIAKADFDTESNLLEEQIKRLEYEPTGRYLQVYSLESLASKFTVIALSIITVLGFGIAFYITRYLDNQLGFDPYNAKGIAKELAKGDMSVAFNLNRADSNSLLFTLEQLRQQLLARDDHSQHALKEQLQRVKFAIDHVTVGVMITDDHESIIYTNNVLNNIFINSFNDNNEHKMDFSLDMLIGKKISELSFIPADEKMLEALTTTKKFSLKLGGHNVEMIMTAVINENGDRLGTVSEWHDRTEDILVETELANVVTGALMGDFTRTFNVQDKVGVMRLLGEGINELMFTNKVSLYEILRVLSAITRGDLTENITNSYFGAFGELKESTNATVDTLKAVITKIKEVTEIISNGAKEIAAGNSNLSHRTEKQAVSLQETTAILNDLTYAVQNNAENAIKANELAIRAAEVASQGGNVISDVIKTMQGINDSSHKVVDIISVIDSIAFQTNILALNAAVEAARAGDEGKGFAVVAGEVRNLAKLSATAAGEIKNLIRESVEKIEEGTQLVAQARKTMDEILHSIQIVTFIMSDITTASSKQSVGIEQVNKAITQMEGVTQQNAALVEQSAAAADSLEKQVQNLAFTVENFKLE